MRNTSSPNRSSPSLHSSTAIRENHGSSVQSNVYSSDDNALPNQVGTVLLHGVPIVSLFIDNKERLCLAQISNTLLKDFSYNEIHNRRVALGITCVQCTPVQLEILRRAGAMPISSRRCGMITKREAERLVKSFLEEHRPPKLPDNFAFRVKHTCGWGCCGQFIPARYNSSRAKCIKCNLCNLFFSPNKFIFHFHRMQDGNYRHPDAANFNSWRRHLLLDYDQPSEDFAHAWEDVKAMFNGGSRKRLGGALTGNFTEEDNTYLPKRQCFPMESDMMFNKKSVQTTPYPLLPISSMNAGNVMFPFNMPPSYPMLPAAENKQHDDRAKCHMIDIWRNTPQNTAMYHPLSLLWAKRFGMYPFHSGVNIAPNASEWARMATPSQPGKSAQTRGDDRFSAFKPVGMSGARRCAESSMNPLPLHDVTSTSRWWNRPKNTYNVCTNSTADTVSMTTDPMTTDPDRRKVIFSEFVSGVQEERLQHEIDECASSPESEVCIEDLPLFVGKDHISPQVDHVVAQMSREVDSEDDIDIVQKESDDETTEPAHAQLTSSCEPATSTAGSSIYEMSKEELQLELLRMMKQKISDT